MAQNKNGNATCPSCGGRGVIATPNGKLWQGCPNCGGEGMKQNVIRVPWSLQFNVVLTPGQLNVPVIVNQDTDADMEWIYTTASSILTNGTAGLFSVTPLDLATGRQLSPGPVNGELYSGTGQLPFVLPEPYIISRGSAFKHTFNERSAIGGQNNTVQLAIHGYKLFPGNAPMQGSAGAIAPANQ